jgi:hypothetical protein
LINYLGVFSISSSCSPSIWTLSNFEYFFPKSFSCSILKSREVIALW